MSQAQSETASKAQAGQTASDALKASLRQRQYTTDSLPEGVVRLRLICDGGFELVVTDPVAIAAILVDSPP